MSHDHHHGHDHHDHAPPAGTSLWRYVIGIGLNAAFVLAEVVAGLMANSTALLADAGHNLSDVLGLALAGSAVWLARRPAKGRRTYGFGKATVLSALGNGLLLVFASGAIVLEAIQRLSHPEPVQTGVMMAVAAIGVLINGGTALLFVAGRKEDVNVRSAFIHMAGDALVSVGVIAAGLLIAVTGASWIDPAVSLAIVVVVLLGAWDVLKEATNLAMDAAPASIDLDAVRAFLEGQSGVSDVHDLHVWGMSTTEPALTAHLVRPADGNDDAFLRRLCHELEHQFGIGHATLQIERATIESCPTH